MQGPDDAIVEYLGDLPAERMNHVHFWQEQPFCAQLWYQKHLNAPAVRRTRPRAPGAKRTAGRARARPQLAGARTARACSASPSAAVTFGDVMLTWYAPGRRAARALARTALRPVALSVADLDAWVAKLRGEGVTFLQEPYGLGDTRAVMIEGPSREAIELVEI